MSDWRAYVLDNLPPLAVRPEREAEIVAELALQLEQAYRDALSAGASEPEARERAQRQISNWENLARDIEIAERQTLPPDPAMATGFLAGGVQDLRYAMRFFRRNPGFAAAAALTLALGIGCNTAVFTMVDAIALHSLPYPEPGRLMAIETRKAQQPEIEPWTSALDFFDIRDRSHSFSAIAGISPIWNVVLTGKGPAERLEVLYVSASFFPILGVNATLGRTFLPQEDNRAKAANVVVLSYSFWRRHFGGRPDVLNQVLVMDGTAFTVTGVLPKDFRYAGEPLAGTATEIEVWFPLAANQLISSPRFLRFLKLTGRLMPGVSPEQARDEIVRIGGGLGAQYPDSDHGLTFYSTPLSLQVTGRLRLSMFLLLGTAGFVLLMACANVANLLLARSAVRRREISIRAALGASRFRLLRQLMTEGSVLAAAGGVLGIMVAQAGLVLLVKTGPESLLRGPIIHLDARALLFTIASVTICAILAGVPSAWRMPGGRDTLHEAGRSLTLGHRRIRSALVVLQLAAALVLLVGASLLIRSFQHLLNIDPGFDAHNLVTISTQVPQSARTPEQRTAIYRLIHDRLLKAPGVLDVAATSRLPFSGSNLGIWAFIEGKSLPGEPGADVEYRVATPNYFHTMGIPLRAGRLLEDRDAPNAASLALINESMARRFWPGENPVGKRMKLGANPDRLPWITVVGIVGDVRHFGLDTQPRPEAYLSYAVGPLYAPILVIRTASDPEPIVGTLAAQVRSVNAAVPAYDIRLMQALVDRSTIQRRFVMWLLSGFALSALMLAGVGIYGVISHSVVQRTQEIGLRMALGASPSGALRLILSEGIRLTITGIILGSLAAAGLTRIMRNLLFEIRPLDPLAFLAAAFILAGFGILACYVPARRATRIDPLTALRYT